MSELKGSETRHDLEHQVIELAAADVDFRQALLEDPRRALHDRFNVDLPGDVELKVLQETPTTFYLVLPVDPAELSETDLGKVAGGALMRRGQLIKLQ